MPRNNNFRWIPVLMASLVAAYLCGAAPEIPRVEQVTPVLLDRERMGLQAVKIGKSVYFLGGYAYADGECLREIFRLTPGRSVISAGLSLGVGRNHFWAMALSDHEILVAGGFHPLHGSLAEMELIDLRSHRVLAQPWLFFPLELFAAVPVGDKVYFLGGARAQQFCTFEYIQCLDLRNGAITLAEGKLVESRFGHAALWLPAQRKILVIGGKKIGRGEPALDGKRPLKEIPVRRLEYYDPKTDQVTWAGELTMDRDRPACLVQPDGKVLIMGGATMEPGQKKFQDTVEVFEPRTGRSEIVARLQVGRMAHRLVPFRDQGVIVSGGWMEKPFERGKILEYYDFVERKSYEIGTCLVARAEHQMVWLNDRELLLVGGKDLFEGCPETLPPLLESEIVRLYRP